MGTPCTRNTKRLTHAQFVTQAILALRCRPYKGIHTVYSGFNRAFREYFPGDDPVAVCRQLAFVDGVITLFLAKGGAVIYLIDEERKVPSPKPDQVLAKILSWGA